ncbi:MAG: T9SS type A sorting domain-containing protein, partial [Ignavibacteria bacterium]
TNTPEYWTSREQWGDRLDIWNIGYNQIFSPYSNPNTKNWNDSATGIFIYYESLSSGNANMKIYKTGEFYTENEILAVTPPSRPMGINLVNYFPPSSTKCNPKIVWNHNTEPDMVRSNGKKKYNVFRAKEPNLNTVPLTYSYLGAVEYPDSVTPYYIDLQVNKYDCGAEPDPQSELYPVRYMVKAVDKFDWESVPSDFVQAIGITGSKEEEDNFQVTSNIPSEYNVFQNYPNPFNPSTVIGFSIPSESKINLSVYNSLGKIVRTLQNGYLKPGLYSYKFNSSGLSGGIYFYTLKTDKQTITRKMLLIK